MKEKILLIARSAVLAALFFTGAPAAMAQDAGDDAPPPLAEQAQSAIQNNAPAQAAMVQMGLTQEQLSGLFGTGEQEEDPGMSQRKTVYKPKSATEVDEPPRLFNNIPKWQ